MDAGAELALLASLAGLNAFEIRAIESGGWNVTRLATLADHPGDVLRAVVWKIQEKHEEFAPSMEVMEDLVRRASMRASVIHAVDAKRGSQVLLDAHVAHQREVRRRSYEESVNAEVRAKVDLVGTAKRTRWPTRLGQKLHLAADDLSLRELAERDRWVKEIKDLVKACRSQYGRARKLS